MYLLICNLRHLVLAGCNSFGSFVVVCFDPAATTWINFVEHVDLACLRVDYFLVLFQVIKFLYGVRV